jgi:hypothetical protein
MIEHTTVGRSRDGWGKDCIKDSFWFWTIPVFFHGPELNPHAKREAIKSRPGSATGGFRADSDAKIIPEIIPLIFQGPIRKRSVVQREVVSGSPLLKLDPYADSIPGLLKFGIF